MASEGNCKGWEILLLMLEYAFCVSAEYYPTEAMLMMDSVPADARIAPKCPFTNISVAESAAVSPHCDTDNISGGFQVVIVLGDHDSENGGEVYVMNVVSHILLSTVSFNCIHTAHTNINPPHPTRVKHAMCTNTVLSRDALRSVHSAK
jgi:hypothetical protein